MFGIVVGVLTDPLEVLHVLSSKEASVLAAVMPLPRSPIAFYCLVVSRARFSRRQRTTGERVFEHGCSLSKKTMRPKTEGSL